MGHCIQGRLMDYWARINVTVLLFIAVWWNETGFYTFFIPYTFADNRNEIDKNNENCDWDIFEMMNYVYAKFYNHSEHLAADEVTVLFRVRVVLKCYFPKKLHMFWHYNFQFM